MFDTRKFLEDHFTDADGVLGLLGKHIDETPPARDAVRKWFSRGSVPAEWMPMLLIALENEQSGPVSLAPYQESGNDIFA